jgi:hypothetical protein
VPAIAAVDRALRQMFCAERSLPALPHDVVTLRVWLT